MSTDRDSRAARRPSTRRGATRRGMAAGLLLAAALAAPAARAAPPPGDLYVATNGSDANSGRTAAAPLATFQRADALVKPGQRVRVRGGTYRTSVTLRSSGRAGSPIVWEPYPGESVIIDGSSVPPAAATRDPWNRTPHTVRIEGSHVTVRGLEVVGSPNSSFMVWGAHDVTLDGVKAHHGYLSGVSTWNSRHVVIENSVLHDFYDFGQRGGNADCIHFNNDGSVPVGEHVVRHNHVYDCSDDGIDTWSQSGNLVERNVVHHCGRDRGDGNGLKLGGEKKGGHNTVRFNLSYQNAMRGFVTNGGRGNLLHNNVAWGHEKHAGFENTDGLPNTYFNNVNAGAHGVDMAGALGSHNTWDLGIRDCRFASTDPASPEFLHLAPGSPCIDAGVPVGDTPFLGAAPDLGAFEAR